jgi:phospholipid transport system transporter-binding protein
VTDTAAHGFQLDTGTPGTLGVRGELSFDTAAAALQVVHMPAGMQALAQVCEVDRLIA